MAEKIVYQTDHFGWYVGSSVADESPLEPCVFHIPAGCFEDAPPEGPYADDLWPRRILGKWKLVARRVAAEPTPQEKLAAFLSQNPDVAGMVDSTGGSE